METSVCIKLINKMAEIVTLLNFTERRKNEMENLGFEILDGFLHTNTCKFMLIEEFSNSIPKSINCYDIESFNPIQFLYYIVNVANNKYLHYYLSINIKEFVNFYKSAKKNYYGVGNINSRMIPSPYGTYSRIYFTINTNEYDILVIVENKDGEKYIPIDYSDKIFGYPKYIIKNLSIKTNDDKESQIIHNLENYISNTKYINLKMIDSIINYTHV